MVHRFKKETTNYELSTTNRNSTGFTLIELLVVIAIIGVLATLGTFTYTDSQKKSRDTRRKSDLAAIQKALELAKQDSSGSYSYLRCQTYNLLSNTACGLDDTSASGTGPDLIPASGTTYIKAMPTDPKSGGYYTYTPAPAGCLAGACTSFTLIACLENIKDTQKEYTDGNALDRCGGSPADGLVGYVITNL